MKQRDSVFFDAPPSKRSTCWRYGTSRRPLYHLKHARPSQEHSCMIVLQPALHRIEHPSDRHLRL